MNRRWFLRETVNPGSVLAEFTNYFLCPGNDEDGWDEKRTTSSGVAIRPGAEVKLIQTAATLMFAGSILGFEANPEEFIESNWVTLGVGDAGKRPR
jgi:hypothetical protein